MKSRVRPNSSSDVPNLDELPDDALLRLAQVLRLVPVKKSTWYLGQNTGRFPRADGYLGPRLPVWRVSTIRRLLADLAPSNQAHSAAGGVGPKLELERLRADLRAGRITIAQFKERRQALVAAGEA